MMKLFVLATILLGLSSANAAEVSGVIELSDSAKSAITETGALFIFARKEGVTAGPPLAVLKIPNPKFPHQFTLTESNVMIGGPEAFAGKVSVTARYSPTGDALDKSGPTGVDDKNKVVKIGFKDLKIKLAK